MSNRTIILKNTLGTPAVYGAITIPLSSQRDVSEYPLKYFKDDLATLLADITSGDVVVNNGTGDLDATRGRSHLMNEIEDAATVVIGDSSSIIVPIGTTGERPSTAIEGMFRYNTTTGSFEVYRAGSINAWETTSTVEQFAGDTYTLDYYGSGKTGNAQWLTYYASNSDEVHAVMPFDAELFGIVFKSKDDDAEPIITVSRAAGGAGATNSDLFVWDIDTACRIAYRTDITTAVSAGDKIAVEIRKDSGSDAQSPHVRLFFRITSETKIGPTFENYNGDFS